MARAVPVWPVLWEVLPFINERSKLFVGRGWATSNTHNPEQYFRCGRFRLIVYRASLCVQYMLDEDQVSVYVIMGEIRPVVEPDHDPVGGCSSGVSLLD